MKDVLVKAIDGLKKGTLKYQLYNSINYHWPFHYVTDEMIQDSLVQAKVFKRLKNKYSYVFDQFKGVCFDEKPSDKVWTVWLQGYNEAPELSKVCISRVIEYFGKDNVTVITLDNINNYINIPGHIMSKWAQGKISYVHLCDYIQIALLAKYGGTWFDATVYIMDGEIPGYFLNNRFFVFDNSYRNSIINISSWFMSSYANSRILSVVQRLLEEYWAHEDGAMHYLILHMFIRMATDYYVDEWESMPKFSNIQSHTLAHEIFKKYTPERGQQIKNMCVIQKLSNKFRFPNNIDNTNYDVLINGGKK